MTRCQRFPSWLAARRRGLLLLPISALLFLASAILLPGGCAPNPGVSTPIFPADHAGTVEDWGIEIIGIRLSAAGYMLDFRYRVVDAEKAAPLFDRKTKPYLIDQATGARFAVPNPPKTGPLRSSNAPIADRNYFMFFANPGRYVKPGRQVTVVIGEFRAENLTVQ